ncbi:hypothetical protein [Streptomyces caniscabiei]|uniref:Uncharacterized protein n=1 Tax=Streptomyces caniscabiei TaxID=2746961 RepID=A0ABU4MIE8_9ACTN|nr:hypothetical protein [Streptomyces caniscabiei]MBE4790968.1 hypothetical protein [Streptomyces caniscabiei]MDX3009595.1 hypothetical protein [Streptomyces caniscabiei]MDX3037240.1 hypothetical protein [Streptomyces caniscabiei]
MIEHTYFGWNQLTHTDNCTDPAWTIDVRHDLGIRPLANGTILHGCPDQHCAHEGGLDRVTVRAVCRSCRTAHLITGEALTRTTTTTDAIGYGQPPREIAGLYLWPSRPVLHGHGPGRSGLDDQPHEYLVTTTPVDRLTPDDCIGAIGWHFNAARQNRWWAGAIQTPPPPRIKSQPGEYCLAWARRSSDHTTVDQAAAWIAATVDPAQQQPLVVAV